MLNIRGRSARLTTLVRGLDRLVGLPSFWARFSTPPSPAARALAVPKPGLRADPVDFGLLEADSRRRPSAASLGACGLDAGGQCFSCERGPFKHPKCRASWRISGASSRPAGIAGSCGTLTVAPWGYVDPRQPVPQVFVVCGAVWAVGCALGFCVRKPGFRLFTRAVTVSAWGGGPALALPFFWRLGPLAKPEFRWGHPCVPDSPAGRGLAS